MLSSLQIQLKDIQKQYDNYKCECGNADKIKFEFVRYSENGEEWKCTACNNLNYPKIRFVEIKN